jgi:acyl transferase domain-containing protein
MVASEVASVEAHGTGTALGDPIEVGALLMVRSMSCGRTGTAVLGALKTNTGHTLAPSGLLGLAKCMNIVWSQVRTRQTLRTETKP